MIKNLIKYLESSKYDINQKGAKILISDKKTMYVVATIDIVQFNKAIRN